MYSSVPSCFWRKLASFPVAVQCLKPCLSCVSTIFSAWMRSVPWVSSTLPSNTLICFASSTRTRSDSRWMGLSRSAFSACSRPLQTRSSRPDKTALLRDLLMVRSDMRQQPDGARLVVEFHADGTENVVRIGYYHRLIGFRPVALGH